MIIKKEVLDKIRWMGEKLREEGYNIKTDADVIEFALRYLEKNYSW